VANAALTKAGAKTFGSQRLARQAAELTAQAGGVLAAPHSFWNALPGATDLPRKLAHALAALREAEIACYGCVALRLNLLVRRQALDRNVWDFLEAARARLKEVDAPEVLERARAALAGVSNPAFALESLADHLRAHPDHQHAETRFTFARALLLMEEAGEIEREGARVRSEWRHAAGRLHKRTMALERELENVRVALWSTLARRDPRFAMSRAGFDVPCRVETGNSESVSFGAAGRRGHLPVPRRVSPAGPGPADPLQHLSIWSAVSLLQPPQ